MEQRSGGSQPAATEQINALQARVRFLESIERVGRAIHSADEVAAMVGAVLATILDELACDRAWLLRPVDPEARLLRIIGERSRPEWPPSLASGVDVPVQADVAAALREALVSRRVMRHGPDGKHLHGLAACFGVRSSMILGVYPQAPHAPDAPHANGPHLLGVHQCSRDRVWSEDDVRLLEHIGARLADALRNLFVLRDLREAGDRLRESEREFRATFELSSAGQAQADAATGRLLRVNRKLCELLGYSQEELLASNFSELTHPDDREPELALFGQLVQGKIPELVIEKRMIRKDGTEAWVHLMASIIYDDDGRPLRTVAIGEDVTRRKRVEKAFLDSHRLLNAVIEGTNDAVFVKDLEGRYRLINSAGARLLGRSVEDVLGKDDRALFSPETAAQVMALDRRVMASGVSLTSEEIATAAGTTRTYLSSKSVQRDERGVVTGLIGIARDITELKQLEEQFRQAQKMEAVGRLAGGVAHDFNNLLTVINGNADLIAGYLGAAPRIGELLAEIQEAGARAAKLTSQLLAFSRKQVLQPEVVDLNVLLLGLSTMLRRLIGEDVDLTFTGAPDLGPACIDPGQFEQAIVNLAVNARDAMPQGGRLEVRTSAAELDEGYAAQHPDLKPGPYVSVTVTDSGAGMDADTRARIFEPFFTTKSRGKGTGLGLPMVYGFVKQSGGHVEVETSPGVGTTIKLYLPRADSAVVAPRAAREPSRAVGGMETILLVEDESSVRSVVGRVLRDRGYQVIEATTGEEALAVAVRYVGPIHLLLTDLVMPRMSGRELSLALRKARAQLRVLYMSGYSEQTGMFQVEEADVALLQKPFNPAALAEKVRAVLDAR